MIRRYVWKYDRALADDGRPCVVCFDDATGLLYAVYLDSRGGRRRGNFSPCDGWYPLPPVRSMREATNDLALLPGRSDEPGSDRYLIRPFLPFPVGVV
jgi:hypothetical protein